MTYPIIAALTALGVIVIAVAALILRRTPWHRLRLGVFIDRNGEPPEQDYPPDHKR